MYVAKWKPLAAAVKHLAAAGLDELAAKTDLCNAIADRELTVRILIDAADADYGKRTLEGAWFSVPTRLSVNDFDWDRSRPLYPWETGPAPGHHYFDLSYWKVRNVALIELLTEDIDRIWSRVSNAFASSELTSGPNKRGPKGHMRDDAAAAMTKAVQTNQLTKDELHRMQQKKLDQFYPGAGQTTLVEARKIALRNL